MKKLPLPDEHSLSSQRICSILCPVYGQNEKEYAFLRRHFPRFEPRVTPVREQIESSWLRLLEAYAQD
jgi:hypothetical protein